MPLVGEDQSQTGRRRLTVAEASEVLGITVEAVRGRIKRRTLEHERDSGTVYVLLEADQSHDQPRPDDDQTSDRPRPDDDQTSDRPRPDDDQTSDRSRPDDH